MGAARRRGPGALPQMWQPDPRRERRSSGGADAAQLPSGKWQMRYYDREGVRRSGGVFPSKSAAGRTTAT